MSLEKYYLWFSIIIAVCALLSPGVVAFVNNRYSLELHKLRSIEKATKHADDVIDGYFRSAGRCLHDMTDKTVNEFGQYRDVIYLYMPTEFHNDISRINDSILDHNKGNMLDEFIDSLAIKYSQKSRNK